MNSVRPLAVLFDLDGTLIDSIELILNSARHAFRDRRGYVPSDAEWLTGVGIPLATMFRRYTRDDAEVDALIAKYREYQLANHDRLVRGYELSRFSARSRSASATRSSRIVRARAFPAAPA